MIPWMNDESINWNQAVLIKLEFYLSISVNREPLWLRLPEQYPETEAAKLNSAVVYFIIHTCACFYWDTSKCLLWEKDLLMSLVLKM